MSRSSHALLAPRQPIKFPSRVREFYLQPGMCPLRFFFHRFPSLGFVGEISVAHPIPAFCDAG